MASKSFRNIISTLAMANGLALSIQQNTNAKTPRSMAEKLDGQCKQAFECWPDSLESKELSKVYKSLERFHALAIPQTGRPELLTSITLGLIDEAMRSVKDPVKRTALDKVEAELWRIHKYYDRKLDQSQTYEAASKAINYWNDGILI